MASSGSPENSSALSSVNHALSQSSCRRVDRIDREILTRVFQNPEASPFFFSEESSFNLNQLQPGLACDFFILAGCVPGLDESSHRKLEQVLWVRFGNQYRKQMAQCAVLWGWLVGWFIHSEMLERTGGREVTNDSVNPVWTCDFGTWSLTEEGERKIEDFISGEA